MHISFISYLVIGGYLCMEQFRVASTVVHFIHLAEHDGHQQHSEEVHPIPSFAFSRAEMAPENVDKAAAVAVNRPERWESGLGTAYGW